MILVGAHDLPFATCFGMRMFLFLAGILIAMAVAITLRFGLVHRSPGSKDIGDARERTLMSGEGTGRRRGCLGDRCTARTG